jgi:hypothetical protein
MSEEVASVAQGAESSSEQSSGQSFDSSQSTQAAPAQSRPVPGQGQDQPQKKESRYEQTKRQKAAFKARQAEFEKERQDFNRQRQEFEASKAPAKPTYTLAELKQYRKEWAGEAEMGVPGREELVEKADQRIMQMEAEEKQKVMQYEMPRFGTPQHRQIWEASEQQLRSEDPDFMRSGSRLDTKIREILSGPNAQLYKNHAYGIYAAYDTAQKEILKEDNLQLQNKIKELTTELERVSGFSSISGGAPGQVTLNGKMSGDSKEFSKLSSAEMKKRILAHQNKPDTSMPWM